MTHHKRVVGLIPWRAIKDARLNSFQKVLLGRIVFLAGKKRRCWPANAWMAEDMNKSERSIYRNLAALEAERYIQRSYLKKPDGSELRIIKTTKKCYP